MNVGTSKTLASFVLMLLARSAGAEGSGAPPWRDSFAARLEAFALLQTLNTELLSHDSATLTLDRWCAAHRLASPAHIVAERVDGADQASTAPTKRRRTSNASFSTSTRRSPSDTAECASSAAAVFSQKRITGTYPPG